MELYRRRPYIQPTGFLLRLLLIVQLFASPFSYVHSQQIQLSEIAKVQMSYGTYSAQPFDEAKASEFLKSVSQNQAALAKSPDGKLLLAKASRARMVLALKRHLDKCFGGDILQLEAAKLALTAAANSDFEPDCTFSNSAFENLDGLTSDLGAWIANDNSGGQTERRSVLVKALFTDTALRAADAESRLRYLFQDPTDAPELLEAMCGSDFKGCPSEFVASFKQRAQAMKQRLQSAGYRPLPTSEVANKLNAEMRAMFDAVYDPSKPYHTAKFDPERWSALAPGKNDPPEYTRPMGEARLTFQPAPNALTHPGLTPEKYQELAEQLQERYQAAIPEDFYQRQSRLRSNEYGLALATSKDWMHALGHGSTIKPVPFVMGTAGVMMGMVSTDRADGETALPVDRAMSLITAKSVRQNRDDSLTRLNDTIGEMGARIFSSSANDKDDQDDLQKLLIANPRAAGELLLRNPKNADLYCEAFLAIQGEENIDKYLNWGLIGLTIGAALVTGGASLLGAGAIAAAGGATLAAVGAVDIVYGVSEGFEQTELGQMQHATCVTEGPDSSACQEYQSTMNSAMTSFALAGIGAAGTGPFLKTLGRLSRGSSRLLTSSADEAAEAARFLRASQGRKLTAALSDAEKGELLAYLSQMDEATRARLAARLDGLSDAEAAAFARKLIEDLRSGKSVSGRLAKSDKATPVGGARIKSADMDPSEIRPMATHTFQTIEGPSWAAPMYDSKSIVRDASGRVKVPPDYRAKLLAMAEQAEKDGYDVVLRRPGAHHNYDLLCFEKGPSTSVLGRIVSSKGAQHVPVCFDPFSTHLGTHFLDEKIVTLSRTSLIDAIDGSGYVLLHEIGHASELRRAVKAGANGFENDSFVPYGRITTIKDPAILYHLAPTPSSVYIEQGFYFDELHSFTRNVNQMVSDAKRGKLSIPPAVVDSFITTSKQNTLAVNHFAYDALDNLEAWTPNMSAPPNGFKFDYNIKDVVVDGRRYEMETVTISKPLTSTPDPDDIQQMEIMIPPGPEDYDVRLQKQLERLGNRSFKIHEDMLRQEWAWERVRPKP